MIRREIMEKLEAITPEEEALLNGSTTIDRELYMAGAGDVVTGYKLLKPDRLITVRPSTRFVHFPEHTHDYVEIVYMCQGSTTHIINGIRIELRAGDVLLLAQNARQEILPAGRDDIAVNFIVKPEFFSPILQTLGEETLLKRFICGCLCGETGTSYLLFRVGDVLPVCNLVENLIYSLLNETSSMHEIDRATMSLLFFHLLNYTDKLSFGEAEQNVIVYVLRYVEENYRSGSLSEIAAATNYNITWLSRRIRQQTGKNFTTLIQEKRMAQAAWFLRNTDSNVDEIARAVGYENLSYFHKLFYAAYGTSPKKYRDRK